MIPLHKVLVADDALEKIKPTLHSGMLTEGPRVKEFEARLEEYLGVPVLATNSCTSAIELALHICGVGPGDEVIGTPLTCAATYVGVIRRGAKLVWADINPETGNIDGQSVAERYTERTKAVIVVDWGGRPVNCYELRRQWTYGHLPAPIIQDAAHSFGARIGGHPAHHADGDMTYCGDFVAWSFQAIKHLTTGDGGALKAQFCEGDKYRRARRLRWFGIDRETKAKFRFLQDIPEAGYKFHMSDWTAALGLANFDAAVKAVEEHRRNAEWLYNALSTVGLKTVKLPPPDPGSSWWFFSLRTPKPLEFVEFAEKRGVGAGPVHGRCDHYTGFDRGHHPLPGVDEYYSQHVAIPCGWWLSQLDLEQIYDAVRVWDKTL
jgi:dTDP-4-amino-4,6-dideoxygalactose transaminase